MIGRDCLSVVLTFVLVATLVYALVSWYQGDALTELRQWENSVSDQLNGS